MSGISTDEVTARLRSLQDIEEIKRLKHAYFRCIDTANIEELHGIMHENVYTCYVGGTYRIELTDRVQFLEMIASAFHSETVARHNGHHPEIEILSDSEARGIWYLHDVFINLRLMTRTEGTALYRDRYRKIDGLWRITEQTYERIYEIVEPLSERPSLRTHYLASHGRKLPRKEPTL